MRSFAVSTYADQMFNYTDAQDTGGGSPDTGGPKQ